MQNRIIQLICLLFLLAGGSLYSQTPYHLTFKVDGLAGDSIIHVANYFGDKTYYFERAIPLASDGSFEIKGDTMPTGGVYLIIPQAENTYFEFIWTEPAFRLETNASEPVSNMKISGSRENELFFSYLNFIRERQTEVNDIKKKLETADGNTSEELQLRLEAIDAEVSGYKENLFQEHPESFCVQLLKMSDDPVVPDSLAADRKASFYYFREHYFDAFDFQDERLLYTPVFHKKLTYYLDQLTVQHPDSLAVSIDNLIEKAEGNELMFRYLVSTITYKYESSKMMGMDAVFVHMGETYYKTGRATWLDSETMQKVIERVDKLNPLLLDKKAPRLVLQDTSGNWHDLYKMNSAYTLLLFYDPTCGHCKKELASLDTIHQELQEKGVIVVGINTELQNDNWKKFMKEKRYGFYLELSDTPERPNGFRDIYDLYSTPRLFLLDKEKRILAKQITALQALEFVTKLQEQEKKSGT